MIDLNVSTLIYRPVKQVFDYVSVPENDFQWQYGTLASVRLSEGSIDIGSSFRSIGHLMGHRVEGTYQVIQFEPNRKFAFKSLSGPLNLQTSYSFEIDGASTRITVSTQANAVNFFLISESVLEKKMKKQLKENLAMLKSLLESIRPADRGRGTTPGTADR